MKATVQYQGRDHEIEVVSARHSADGEFAGNIDLVVDSSPPLDVSRHLRLMVQGVTPEWLSAIGAGEVTGGLGVTFHSSVLEGVLAPEKVAIGWWSGTEVESVGVFRCSPA